MLDLLRAPSIWQPQHHRQVQKDLNALLGIAQVITLFLVDLQRAAEALTHVMRFIIIATREANKVCRETQAKRNMQA